MFISCLCVLVGSLCSYRVCSPSPDEKIFSEVTLFQNTLFGVSNSAPKNTVSNQYKKQLLAVAHLAPKKFVKRVCQWQDEKEKKEGIRAFTSTVRNKEMIMTRKAVADAMSLEFTGGRAKCPLCQMEYGRSGLAVHFARCNHMNEEQRRTKTTARIRETTRRRTDLSVELSDMRGHAKKASQDSQPKKKDATDLQK